MYSVFLIINIILIVIILAFFASWVWEKIMMKQVGGALTNQEFKAGMRRAQIVDVREAKAFKKQHIDGARNIPYSQFKTLFKELRTDLPVYVYSDTASMTLRCMKTLKKNGYQKIYWLKDGYDQWDGRTKASKY